MKRTLSYGLAVALAGTVTVFASRTATGAIPLVNFVELQSSFPGTVQTGHVNVSGVIKAGYLRGDGASVTNIGASNISTGLLNPARLGPTVAKTDQLNTFAAVQRFASNILVTSQLSSVIFPAVDAQRPPMISMFASGTDNAARMVIGHSPAFQNWGLQYDDVPDRFNFLSGGTAVMTVDLGQERVGIGTSAPTTDLEVLGDMNASSAGVAKIRNGGTTSGFGGGRYGLQVESGGDGAFCTGSFGGAASTIGSSSFGVYGTASGNGVNYAVLGVSANGSTNYGGYFSGLLYADSSTAGVKSFLIDHPLDPENKLLEHSSIESNERMNIYRGHITTDASGYATVTPPNWFSALNKDVQVQLTVVDDSDDFVLSKVVRENPNGTFVIRTSKGSVRVNWMLSGVRHDATSNHFPLRVEREKPEGMKGKYMVPEAYGFGQERAMNPLPTRRATTEKAPSN